MTALVDRIHRLLRRGTPVVQIADIVGLSAHDVIARLVDPNLPDPASGVGLLPEAAGSASVSVSPASPYPLTLPYDPDLLALVTGSGGPDGANSYLNNTAADVTAAPVVIPAVDLARGVYAFDALGAYGLQVPDAAFGANGATLLAELRKHSDNSRVGWAMNNDPFESVFTVNTADMRHGDFNGDMHAAGGQASTTSGGTFYLADDMTVTFRAVNLGGYAQDPFTGEQDGRDIDITLGLSIRAL